jgi:hypothetical protein
MCADLAGVLRDALRWWPAYPDMGRGGGGRRGGGELGDAGDCAVCLSELEAEDGVRLLPCMHVFHTRCIDGWLGRSKLCPSCKGDLLAS